MACVKPCSSTKVFYTLTASTSTTATTLSLPVCVKNHRAFYVVINQDISGKTATAPVVFTVGGVSSPLVDMIGTAVESSAITQGTVLLVVRSCTLGGGSLTLPNYLQATA